MEENKKIIGSIWYVSGSKTKVSILNKSNKKGYFTVKILDRTPASKFQIDDIVQIYGRILYPRQGR